MRHVPLNELQVGIKLGVRNNHLRFADDCPLLAESKEELKSFLMRVKEENERMDLRLKKEKKKKLRSWQWHLAPLLHGKQKGKWWK